MQKGNIAGIPDPDYKKHPAYGRYFGAPTFADRMGALFKFVPYLSAYLFFSIIHRQNFRKPTHFPSQPSDFSPLAQSLIQDGVTAVRLNTQDKQTLNLQLDNLIESLRKKQMYWKKRTKIPWRTLLKYGYKCAYFSHENGRLRKDLYVREKEAPQLFASLRKTLRHHGVLDAANEYLGRPVDVQFLRLTLRDARRRSATNPFRDLEDFASRTSHMHIDHVWTVKCILYIGEVYEENGPFCYCTGSHKLNIGWLESQVRRANDRAMLSCIGPESRKRFAALPTIFQKKAKFGNDLIADSPEVKNLLEKERCFTSRDGDLIAFDDKGIHRGGLVDQGARWALQIRLG